MNCGFLPLNRKLRKHWLYADTDRFGAWVKILFEVSYKPDRVFIKGKIYDIGIGESLNSLETWRKCFGRTWTIQKVRSFFSMLKADGMIATSGDRITTRLTVLNYKSYELDNTQDNKDKPPISEEIQETPTDEQHTNNTQSNTEGNTEDNIDISLILEELSKSPTDEQQTKQHTEQQQKKKEKTKSNIKKKVQKEKAGFVYRSFDHLSITLEEVGKLKSKGYEFNEIDHVIGKIQNWKNNTKYKSLYLTSLDWLKREYGEKTNVAKESSPEGVLQDNKSAIDQER